MWERELPDGTLHCSQIYKAAKHIVCKMSTTEKKLALPCFLADLESSQACSLQNKRHHPGKEAKHHKPPLPVAPFLQWEKVHRSSCSMIFYLLSASCSTSSCIHLLQLWSFFLLQKKLDNDQIQIQLPILWTPCVAKRSFLFHGGSIDLLQILTHKGSACKMHPRGRAHRRTCRSKHTWCNPAQWRGKQKRRLTNSAPRTCPSTQPAVPSRSQSRSLVRWSLATCRWRHGNARNEANGCCAPRQDTPRRNTLAKTIQARSRWGSGKDRCRIRSLLEMGADCKPSPHTSKSRSTASDMARMPECATKTWASASWVDTLWKPAHRPLLPLLDCILLPPLLFFLSVFSLFPPWLNNLHPLSKTPPTYRHPLQGNKKNSPKVRLVPP